MLGAQVEFINAFRRIGNCFLMVKHLCALPGFVYVYFSWIYARGMSGRGDAPEGTFLYLEVRRGCATAASIVLHHLSLLSTQFKQPINMPSSDNCVFLYRFFSKGLQAC